MTIVRIAGRRLIGKTDILRKKEGGDRLGKGHIATLTEKRVREAEYERMQKKPPPRTWSARMPAYCYTELCPVSGLRRWPAEAERR